MSELSVAGGGIQSGAGTPDFEVIAERGPLRVFSWVERIAAAVFLLGVYLGVVIQVAARYLPIPSWPGAGEMARYSLVGITFVLVGYLIGQQRHIRIDLIDKVLPPRVLAAVKALSYLVIAAISIAFMIEAVALVESQSGTTTTALRIPMSIVFAIPAVAFALAAVRAVQQTVLNIVGVFARPAPVSSE